MTDFTAPLSIELDGLTIDTEATFAIDEVWDGRHLIEAKATLLNWRCDGRDLPRARLVKLLNALVIDGDAVETSFAVTAWSYMMPCPSGPA